MNTQQHLEAVPQPTTPLHPQQSHPFRRLQSQARYDYGAKRQTVAEDFNGPSLNGPVSDSFLFSAMQVRPLIVTDEMRPAYTNSPPESKCAHPAAIPSRASN